MISKTLFCLLAGFAGLVAGLPAERGLFPRLGGVNLAGCEFGMSTDGRTNGFLCPPVKQVHHFKHHGVNLIRLPIGWQYLVGSKTDSSSKSFDAKVFEQYDDLVQAVISDPNTFAIIDIHNYARWEGGIVGQGGSATTEHFATLWWMLADKYKGKKNVVFGLMNEPHDVDMNQWAKTCQSAINAIRAAGAKDQIILLPGNGYSAVSLFSQGANDPLLTITDPARPGSTSHLHFDAHMYIDSSYGGKNSDCIRNGIDDLANFGNWLKSKGRQAMLTEIGAGDNGNCHKLFGEQIAYLSSRPEVFSGWTVWSAGSFKPDTYALSITPFTNANGEYRNNELFNKAIKPHLP